MSRRKRKPAPAPGGPPMAPEWVVTFTDMISLLVTFFVLLMTFSSMVDHEVLRVESLLSGKSGIFKNDSAFLTDAPKDDLVAATDIRRGASLPHVRPADKLSENLAEMGARLTEEHVAIDFRKAPDGLLMEFGERETFAPGSDEVNASLRAALREIAGVLANYPNLIVVEGFADDDFRSTLRHPTALDLSYGRAEQAARVLLEASGLSPELVQVAGLENQEPRGDAATAEGRKQNRRVRLRILSLSRLRADHLEAQEDR